MIDKVIKELKEALDSLDITNKNRLNLIRAIEYLQEEPVSEELEGACEQLTENARKHKAETSSPFFSQTDYKQGVIDGANWQKKQTIRKSCEWLRENIYQRVYKEGDSLGFPTAVFLEDFRKAMEE